MSREAFEAWIKRDSTLSVERDGEGYRDMDVYLMWRAWQAAQADAFERAAKVCHETYMELTHGVDRSDPTDDWEWGAKSDVAKELREDIRALAKDVT